MPSSEHWRRLRELLSELFDVEHGALYWARETAWTQANADYEKTRREDRVGHPGCAHEPTRVAGATHVRMLHGHSLPRKRRYEFKATGLSEGEPKPTTWFDVLHPYAFPNELFFSKQHVVYPNTHKPALSAEEKAALARVEDAIVEKLERDEQRMQREFAAHAAWRAKNVRDE
jgi:hypothetical protein